MCSNISVLLVATQKLSPENSVELRKLQLEGKAHSPHQLSPQLRSKPCLSLGRMRPYLLPIFFILNGIHCTARLGIEHEVEASVFTEATGIAQEGVLFIIVDGSEKPQ